MHELSIAEALWERAQALAPAGAVLRRVKVRAGPMRGIDPEIMRTAWETLAGSGGALLELEFTPWRLRCPDCGAEFDAGDVMAACGCGGTRAYPIEGDELRLVSLIVEDAPAEVNRGVS